MSIEDTHHPMPMEMTKNRAAAPHREFMFARALHQNPDVIEQHNLLSFIADETRAACGQPSPRCSRPSTGPPLREAHRRIEAGAARGRIVVEASRAIQPDRGALVRARPERGFEAAPVHQRVRRADREWS